MAIPININDLIDCRVVESNRVEFKSDWNPTPIIHSICAFANDIDNVGGGYIVVGVEEKDGTPVLPVKGIPQERVDGILKELIGLCHMIEPLYYPVVEPVLFQGKYIIVIWVSGGHGRPYKAAKDVHSDKPTKLYYIRKFSSTIVASPEKEKELFYISTDIPFDDRPNLAADVSDLDIGLMRSHLKEIGSSLYEHSLSMDALDIAKNMQLVAGPPEAVKPLNVGLLMFSERPEKYFRYARIEVVDIPDPTGTNMTEKVFTGPIQRQLSDALAFIKNYTLKEVVIKSADRAEATRISNYPYAAIEEILANAVYHRSYQEKEPITVRITSESIEITSFPGFDRSISDKDIAELRIRARVYRNRRIGDFLKELKLIEGRNTGFPNAIKALKANGSGMPRFEMDNERSFLSVTIPIHPYFLKASSDKDTEYREKILVQLRTSPMNRTELAKALGMKGISRKLSAAVEQLIAEGNVVQIVVGGGVKLAAGE
jgi:ATP-dependent DNA helicase RecG